MCLHPSRLAQHDADLGHSGSTREQVVVPARLRELTRLRRVRDRIDREYAQPLDVEALARSAHMPAGHLSRDFRCAYGQSPYSYLMTWRIQRASALLRYGDHSVADVCVAVGCSSEGIFDTRFTELIGVPPGAYRHNAARGCEGAAAHGEAGTDRSGIEKRWSSSRT